jgi:hypothetical protein
VNQIYQRAGDAVGILTDIQWEHQRLFGQPLPISPSELVRQADAVKLDPMTYASRKYDYAGKRTAMEKKQQEDHDAKIRRDAEAARDKIWAERVGSNPDVRIPVASRYSDADKAVRAGKRPDPLMLNETDRRRATSTAIRTDLAEGER